ncbi:hypothetical protein WDL1CHR_05407 [Variovorax sp. WDL1]|nr:hypothetical protein WDL1CHR_05407 [Variovorax sp. WDL1]
MQKKMSPDEAETAQELTELARYLIEENGEVQDDLPDADPLSNDIGALLAGMRAAAAKHPGSSPEAQQQRRLGLIEFMGRVFENKFESPGARLAASAVNTTFRTGSIVFTFILTRNAIAFAVAKHTRLGDSESLLAATSIAMVAVAPILNLIGGIRSVVQKTANITSIASRAAMLLLNCGLGGYCLYKFRALQPSGIGALQPLGRALHPFVAFNIFRDAAQLGSPLSSNIRSLPIRAIFLSGLLYAGTNFLATIAAAQTVPQYGSGALPQAFGNQTVSHEMLAAAVFNAQASAGHSGYNVVVELLDDWCLHSLVRYFENKDYAISEASNLQDEAVHRYYSKDLTDFATNLLDKPAQDREDLIDENNFEIYGREVKRLATMGPLDEAHALYLAKLREEYQRAGKPAKLRQLWREYKKDPGSFGPQRLAELADLEKELDVYKKPRELARLMKRPRRLKDHEELLLKEDVARDFKHLQKLRQKHALSEAEEKILEKLEYEFNPTDDELEKFRPISCLMNDKAVKYDFTNFDKRLRRICRRVGATKEERQKISREVFIREFTLAYFPNPIFTKLEREVLTSMNAMNLSLASNYEEMVEAVDEQRRKDTEGMRLSLVPPKFSSFNDFLSQLTQKFLLTNALRQGAFFTVVAAVVGNSDLLDGLGPWEQMLGLATIVYLSVFLAYPGLFLGHTEGDKPGQAVEGPGFTGLTQFGAEKPPTQVDTPRGNTPTRGERSINENDDRIESSDLSEADILPQDSSQGRSESSSDDEVRIPVSKPGVDSRNNKTLKRQHAVVNLDKIFE